MEILQNGLPSLVALAAVATLGYLFGRQQLRNNSQRHPQHTPANAAGNADQAFTPNDEETHEVIRELQRVSSQVRLSLAAHHATVLRFNESIQSLRQSADGETLRQLGDEAERILHPTRQLSVDIAHAYDELRRHAGRLQLQKNNHPAPRHANQRTSDIQFRREESSTTGQ